MLRLPMVWTTVKTRTLPSGHILTDVDVIMEYSFNHSRDRLQKPDFGEPAQEAVLAMSKVVHWMKHYHWLIYLAQLIPPWIVSWISPT